MLIAVLVMAGSAIYLALNPESVGPLLNEAGSVGGDPVMTAIRNFCVARLDVPAEFQDAAANILYAQYKLETASGTAWYFNKTKNLWNRHIGSGRGEWIGAGKPHSALKEGVDFVYVAPGDPDIRCYADFSQCARDYVQLMNDGLYAQALAALRRGSAPDYYNALHSAGYSTQMDYATALQGVYDSIA